MGFQEFIPKLTTQIARATTGQLTRTRHAIEGHVRADTSRVQQGTATGGETGFDAGDLFGPCQLPSFFFLLSPFFFLLSSFAFAVAFLSFFL